MSRQNVYFLGSIFIALVTVGCGVEEIYRNVMWYTNVSDQSHCIEPKSWTEDGEYF
jgi:hypothetical protein